MSTLNDLVPAGVITGEDVQKVFDYAKAEWLCPARRQLHRHGYRQRRLETAARAGHADDHPVLERRRGVLCRQGAEQ